MKNLNGRLSDENLDKVNGGSQLADNALFDKIKNKISPSTAIKDDSVKVTGRLLAGEASVTEKDPLNKINSDQEPIDTIGRNISAGSGMA